MRWRSAKYLVLAILGCGSLPAVTHAATIDVIPGRGSLAAAIAAAAPGDTLHLLPGRHEGPVVIEKTLTLEGIGPEQAWVVGNATGSVIRIEAPDVTVRMLHITGSGTNSTEIDAGIYVAQGADNPLIERNIVEGNLFGISLHGPKNALVQHNVIRNRNDLWLNNRGNGIHMWNNVGSRVERNDVAGGRDGIFVQLGSDNVIAGNIFEKLRFAVHFMYSKRGSVSDNLSIGNHVGYALMYSDSLKVVGNVSARDRDYGLMLNSARKGEILDNLVYSSADKCLFVYLAVQNELRNNRFEGCGVGVHVTGSDANVIAGNAFVGNRVQMRYAGTKSYEWSADGHGNYWSDNPAFDLDGDGIGDTAYRPNNIVDWVVWRYPLSKLLLSSPAMEILRVGQSQFPALYPGGVVDSYPLMSPPRTPRPMPEIPAEIIWEEGKAESSS
ncbi:nitrous oxide reductase family maturation protein NosD [Dongia sp.]|uniref:nitrous oxide reductase family maturation protein NosD n=1 Tax=Dongia sp. TaxID=1977262 RepID=UPI0035AF85A8